MASHYGWTPVQVFTGHLCKSSSEKWPSNSFANFFNGSILLCSSSSYILSIRVSCQTHDLQIFSILDLLLCESSQVLQQTAFPCSGKKISENTNYIIFLKSTSPSNEEQLRGPQPRAWKGHWRLGSDHEDSRMEQTAKEMLGLSWLSTDIKMKKLPIFSFPLFCFKSLSVTFMS